MRSRTKPDGAVQEYKRLKKEDENIETRIAVLYNEEGMKYEKIAEVVGAKLLTIRYIHNRYIEMRIEEYKKNKKNEQENKFSKDESI